MSRVCQVTGKRPESEKRFVTLRVSAKGMRVIDKKGIETVLSELRARGEKY
ncbi:hypothetical protein [Citrobacter sp.]|uniref:large ribosomal subunit protein bL28 n=1 Tax=Citrobacter sp. TaxID=1896336 RepID=UPI0029035D58|nr:hypothetical protein [Citrobacter sp.]MDU1001847.1 hypothetical protein [Citrobacter sp.]